MLRKRIIWPPDWDKLEFPMNDLIQQCQRLLDECEDLEDAKQYAQDIAEDLGIDIEKVYEELEQQYNAL